jgi:hypothetical protein
MKQFFLAGKERPAVAPFLATKKRFIKERLQRKAGNSSKKNASLTS